MVGYDTRLFYHIFPVACCRAHLTWVIVAVCVIGHCNGLPSIVVTSERRYVSIIVNIRYIGFVLPSCSLGFTHIVCIFGTIHVFQVVLLGLYSEVTVVVYRNLASLTFLSSNQDDTVGTT